MSPEVDTVLAKTVFAEIAIVFVIVLVAESWTIFWDNMCFQWHSQLQCSKWRVERTNSSCNPSICMWRFHNSTPSLNRKHKRWLRRKTNHQICFIEDCYRFFSFIVFSDYSSPQWFWATLIKRHYTLPAISWLPRATKKAESWTHKMFHLYRTTAVLCIYGFCLKKWWHVQKIFEQVLRNGAKSSDVMVCNCVHTVSHRWRLLTV